MQSVIKRRYCQVILVAQTHATNKREAAFVQARRALIVDSSKSRTSDGPYVLPANESAETCIYSVRLYDRQQTQLAWFSFACSPNAFPSGQEARTCFLRENRRRFIIAVLRNASHRTERVLLLRLPGFCNRCMASEFLLKTWTDREGRVGCASLVAGNTVTYKNRKLCWLLVIHD